MWNGKKKAVTFSYDDGNEQDRRLVPLMNKYGVKGTFNINSGVQTPTRCRYEGDIAIRRMNIRELAPLYAGHEIAAHGLTHASLPDFDSDTIRNEVELDKFYLEQYFHITVNGLAYPMGTYNDIVVQTLKDCGYQYARTIESNHSFALQEDLLRFKPTCHHDDPKIFDLIDRFLNSNSNEPQLLYIWGHSFEFDTHDNWDHMEEVLKRISGHDDVFYGTNTEVLLQH